MNRTFNALLAAGLLLLSPLTAHARDPGDPKKGLVVAQSICASCHAIDASTPSSPNHRAPPFPTLAQTPGMTVIALRAALQTSHRTMPNLAFSKQGRDDVIAYILSLKKPPALQPISN